MCSCNRYRLDQQNINYTYSYQFDDCNCSEDYEIFLIKCENCFYNLTGFGRIISLPYAAFEYIWIKIWLVVIVKGQDMR